MSAPRHPDAPRSPGGHLPHVESWFLRFVDPASPRALWLKITTLEGRTGGNPDVAEAWAALFQGDSTFAVKQTIPREEALLLAPPLTLGAAGAELSLDGESGHARGALPGIEWELKLQRLPGPLGAPLCLYPTARMIDAPFPKNQLLTPRPALRASGRVQLGGQTIAIDGWLGSEGHNWGPAHPERYAWGQALFLDAAGEPFALAEGASGSIRVGGLRTPLLSLLVVRRGAREYRFDRVADLWNQRARLEFPRWSLAMEGPDGRAELTMEASRSRIVGLGYENPDGSVARCLNSKLARVTLRLNPTDDDPFTLTSAHVGALEFLVRGEAPPFPLQA